MTDDKIRYSDIIQPDDSIEKLIRQLSELSQSYETMVDTVVSGADKVARSLKNSSGATSEGRRAIDDAVAAASRLERAEKELSFALSEVGQKVAWVKAQTADANKVSVEQARQAKALAGSYEKIKLELNENAQKWKAMSDTQRTSSEEGERTLNTIIGLRTKLAELDAQLRPTIDGMAKLRKAEQELAFWQSQEGEQLANTNAKIREVKKSYADEKTEVDAVARAAQNLTRARSKDNELLQLTNALTREANREAKLTAQLNNSAEGSYNALAAQYELNKIKLNAMSGAQREAADAGKKLEVETKEIYRQMIKLQEATGNHRLSVGHYEKAWDGLGMSVSAIVRELPSAAVSMNTFFLAISNNLPLLADEITRLRAENAKAIASGKEGKSVVGALTGALFSWNTAMVLGISALVAFGEEIVNWIANLIKGEKQSFSMKEAIAAVTAELENTNGSYGANIVILKKLQAEWNNLKTAAEKNQWIKDNKSEFDKLQAAVTSVNDADRVFIYQTAAVIKALQLRAKAAAAEKLAQEEYESLLKQYVEIETTYSDLGKFSEDGRWLWFLGHKGRKEEAYRILNSAQAGTAGASSYAGAYLMGTAPGVEDAQKLISRDNQLLSDLKKLEESTRKANIYTNLAIDFSNSADKLMESVVGSQPKATTTPKTTTPKTTTPKTTEPEKPKDLSEEIARQGLDVLKRYEQSITRLELDELKKREQAREDAREHELRQLELRQNEIDKILKADSAAKGDTFEIDGKKYKKLTEEQKTALNTHKTLISKIAENTQVFYKQEQEALEFDSKERLYKIEAAAFQRRLGVVKKGSEEELELKLQILETERNLAVLAEQRQHRELYGGELTAIDRELNAITQRLSATSDPEEIERLQARQKELQKSQVEIIGKRTSNENAIKEEYAKKEALIKGEAELEAFENTQKLQEEQYAELQSSERKKEVFLLEHERDLWAKKIELAEKGMLDWSQSQIDIAKQHVVNLNKKISDKTGFKGFVSDIAEYGVVGGILASLGFSDDQIAALEDATTVVLDNLSAIFEAEVEMAEKEVEMAKERADAAKSAYEAEVEARNNGYANNVATAKKEMQLAKKNQREKEKLLEDAQRKQQAVDTAIQVSSLVTAAANIWSVFSKTNPFLAIATITTMFGSFAAAKIKAAQAAKAAKASTQEYGEGGLEFLEGGSHASGNDIDLGTKNSRGKNMRAEGGEAMAIINKRSTRKYRKHLPLLIDSLNKGTFEDKYLRAFDAGENIQIPISNSSVNVDLSRLERDVTEIKKQNSTKYYNLNNGTTLVVKGNVKRYIR